jgi:glycosyltransferase involved in cell wall biosynthesis
VAGVGLKLLVPQVPAMQIFHYTYRGFSQGALKGLPGYLPSRYLHPYIEKLTANGKKVVAVSHKTRRELERYYGRTAKVIENAVSLDVFRPLPKEECREKLGIDWDGPIGIFVGRADNTKGFDVVRRIAKTRQDIRVLCVTGSDIHDQDMILARTVANEDMPTYYSAADFLLFPSRYESASYSTIEALACDIPVVAHRTGLFEDISEENVGRILDRVDADLFSKAIDDVLKMGRLHTRRCAERRFSMERFVSEYRDLAEEMVRSGPGP